MNAPSPTDNSEDCYPETLDTIASFAPEQKKQREQRKQRSTEFKEFLTRYSDSQKLRFYYLDYGPLTDKEAAGLLYDDEAKAELIKSSRNRLAEIQKANDDRPAKYGLTSAGHAATQAEFSAYLAELRESADKVAREEQQRLLPQSWQDYLETDTGRGSPMAQAEARRLSTGSDAFVLDWADLIRVAPDLAEGLEADVQYVLSIIRALLKKETGLDWSVIVRGYNDRSKIARLRVSDYGRLINLHGEVIGKGTMQDRSTMQRYECVACGYRVVVQQTIERKTVTRPAKCPQCKHKGMRHDEKAEEVLTFQAVTLQDIPELLRPGETPCRLPCWIIGAIAEESAERFNIGSKITITGCYVRQREPGLVDYERVFLVFGAEELSEDILNLPASPEVLQEVKRIRAAPDPLAEVSRIAYSRVVGHDTPKQILSLQPFSDGLHVLLMGDPGTGKTELAKCSAAAYPRSDFFQATNSTKTGLTASASKDKHTERFVLEANGISRLHPFGVAGIDELDKAGEDVKFSLLNVMQDGVLRMAKTNVQSKVPCQVSVLATANPRNDSFSEYSEWWAQVNLPKPLYDRFHVVLLFASQVSSIKSFRDYFLRRIKPQGGTIGTQERIILRELVREAHKITPRLDDEATLAFMDRLMLEVIVPNKEVYGSSLRLTSIIPQLLTALCRLTGDERPREWHFAKLTDLLMSVRENHQNVRRQIGQKVLA